jgi:hypothetical protein
MAISVIRQAICICVCVCARARVCEQQEELQNLTKDINRTVYTRRILEILANIHKQKDGINKVCIR